MESGWNSMTPHSVESQSNLWASALHPSKIESPYQCVINFQSESFIRMPIKRCCSTSDIFVPFTFFTIKNNTCTHQTHFSPFSQWKELERILSENLLYSRNDLIFGFIGLVSLLFLKGWQWSICLQVERKKIGQNIGSKKGSWV